MKAVIDRFEGDFALVLFGDEEIKKVFSAANIINWTFTLQTW